MLGQDRCAIGDRGFHVGGQGAGLRRGARRCGQQHAAPQ
jgi:hypothetical protein